MLKGYRNATQENADDLVKVYEDLFDISTDFYRTYMQEYMASRKMTWSEYENKRQKEKNQIKKLARRNLLYRIFSVELSIYFFMQEFHKAQPTVRNVWSIYPGFDSVLPKVENIEALHVLRVYFKFHFTLPAWENEVQWYMNLANEQLKVYKLVEVEDELGSPLVELTNQDEFLGGREKYHREILRKDSRLIFAIQNSDLFAERERVYKEWLQPEMVLKEPRELLDFVSVDEEAFIFLNDQYLADRTRLQLTHFIGEKKKRGLHPNLLRKTQHELREGVKKLELPTGREKIPKKCLALQLGPTPWQQNALLITKAYRNQFPELEKPRDMEKAQNEIDIHSLYENTHFEYEDKVGTSGIVGAGKSTFLILETIRITNLSKFDPSCGQNGKVAIWTENVTEALMLVYRLHQLAGIKAIPIIGKGQIKKHLKDFISRVKSECEGNNQNPLSKLSMEYVLQFFKGECSLEILYDLKDLPRKPCTSIRVHRDRRNREGEPIYEQASCPLYHNCGMYVTERHLAESSVWIGTEKAFTNSRPMPLVNPRSMTYAELAYHEMDVIFVDEADSIQSGVEGSFNTKNDILGGKETIFEKEFLMASHEFETNYELSGADVQIKWMSHVSEAKYFAHLIYEQFKNSAYVRKKIADKSFAIHTTMVELTAALFEIPRESYQIVDHPFFRLNYDIDFALLHAPDDAHGLKYVMTKRLDEFYTTIKQIKNFRIRPDIISGYIQQEVERFFDDCIRVCKESYHYKPLKQLDEEKERDLKQYFYFLLLLKKFDFHFKGLVALKQRASQLLENEINDINRSYHILKRYLPFIPDSATGSHFQYFFKENRIQNKGSIGILQTYDYLGVGRKLLTDFGKLYEHIVPIQGPSMVYMSATMFAEGSMHYHVDVPLKYIIHPRKEPGKIKQFLLPVYENEFYYDGDGNKVPVCVSGEVDKETQLRKMAELLVPHIKNELAYWNHAGRKVLIVVNSYAQVKPVAEVLKRRLGDSKVYCLKQTKYHSDFDQGNLLDDSDVLLGEVERLALKEADVLIVPLMTINRGYNILKYNEASQSFDKDSYFGSAFFMVRPYFPYDDIGNVIQVVNGSYLEFEQDNQDSETPKRFYDGVAQIRKQANDVMFRILGGNVWLYMDEKDREILGWYTLINILQMIGRLLRGQSNARIFYVDAKFALECAKESGKEDDESSSIIKTWIRLLENQQQTGLSSLINQILYGEFLQGLKKIFT